MADQTVSITIPDAYVAEVRAAVQQHMGLDSPASADDFKQFVRRQVRAIVLKYRESQRADIDRTDPTAD